MTSETSTSERWGGFDRDPLPQFRPPRWLVILILVLIKILLVLFVSRS
jgi:hypothetical protein